ncbi:NAD-dependent epimerase/dehydratase family protein [Nostoc sp. CHAB 5844]|nr:NAD-dependent epimerase/dehydratase family protein [Nostoc sp. CHAB 5844]
MSVVIITGSAGLIGSEAVRFFGNLGMHVVGIDNDMRKFFFGEEASTDWNRKRLETEVEKYEHYDVDIRDYPKIKEIFERFGKSISLIIHTAAQPSHDWAARDPFSDFSVNANGTLNLLQATRENCPDSPFIFTSTNKVYGDLPNFLPLVELEKRWEIDSSHRYYSGISEDMSIDNSKHSLFGASKVAADVLVQEYGRYFDMKTVSFRGGCLTGPSHSGTQLHGFLAYLMKCTVTGNPYTIFGYKGKQVRDNIHSSDLIAAFYEFYKNPGSAEIYNIGGGRESNCSMLEAIEICQEISGRELQHSYKEDNRIGDHIWYISDLSKFKNKYPNWSIKYNVTQILQEIYDKNVDRWL